MKRRTSGLGFGIAIVIVAVLPPFTTAALVTRIGNDFDFDRTTLGIAVAVFYAVGATISPACGRFVARAGQKRAIILSCAGTATGCLLIAVVANSGAAVVVMLAPTAVGTALCSPIASAYLQADGPITEQGVPSGVLQAGAPAASLVAGIALPLIAIPFGWRWVYLMIAAASFVVAATLRPTAVTQHRSAPGPELSTAQRSQLRRLAVTALLGSVAGVAMVSFLVVFAAEHGMSETEAGLLVAALGAASVVVRIALGAYADRVGGPVLGLTSAMMAIGAIGYLALIIETPAAIVAGAIFASALAWSWATTLTVACLHVAPGAGPRAVAIMMSGLFAGAAAGPLLGGVLAQHDQFTLMWCVCAACALTGAVVLRGCDRA